MNIGKLTSYCRVEHPVITQEGEYGTPVTTWTLLTTSWFNMQDMLPSRSEAVKNGLNISAIQTRVRGRYPSDVSKQINASMRIVTQSIPNVTYNLITEPAILGNREGVEFMVERVSS